MEKSCKGFHSKGNISYVAWLAIGIHSITR